MGMGEQMTMSDPVRAWAIRGPYNHLICVDEDKETAWNDAETLLCDDDQTLKSKGYRAVRVEIREVSDE
jgi:hypothetical protein